jgi:hypothetical protein
MEERRFVEVKGVEARVYSALDYLQVHSKTECIVRVFSMH